MPFALEPLVTLPAAYRPAARPFSFLLEPNSLDIVAFYAFGAKQCRALSSNSSNKLEYAQAFTAGAATSGASHGVAVAL